MGGLHPTGKRGSLCWDRCTLADGTSLPSAAAAGGTVPRPAPGPYLLCLSQARAVVNPAEPRELPASPDLCSGWPYTTLKLNSLLLYYRTATFEILDGQLECKYAGNSQCSMAPGPSPAGRSNTSGPFQSLIGIWDKTHHSTAWVLSVLFWENKTLAGQQQHVTAAAQTATTGGC